MELYKVRKRYQEAVDQGKSILAMKGVNRELEDEVRVEIAVCLDFLGRIDEAAMERMAVADDTDDRPQGFLGWRARGKALEKQHRYEQAVEAYEKAFELSHSVDKAARDELLVRLVLASFNAGKPEVTMAWANARSPRVSPNTNSTRFIASPDSLARTMGISTRRNITINRRMNSPSVRRTPGRSWIVSRLWRRCIARAASWTLQPLSV